MASQPLNELLDLFQSDSFQPIENLFANNLLGNPNAFSDFNSLISNLSPEAANGINDLLAPIHNVFSSVLTPEVITDIQQVLQPIHDLFAGVIPQEALDAIKQFGDLIHQNLPSVQNDLAPASSEDLSQALHDLSNLAIPQPAIDAVDALSGLIHQNLPENAANQALDAFPPFSSTNFFDSISLGSFLDSLTGHLSLPQG